MSETSVIRDKNLQIIFGVTLMAVLGVSSITPIFPSIMEELNISPGKIGLLITFFTLPGVFLAPIMGIIADRVGRKRVLVPSLFLFAIAGVSCSLVHDFNLLLLLRFIQGIGAASLGSINTTMIGDLYEGIKRSKAMGLNASILEIGTAVYPSIGGALAIFGWHYPFLLPITALPIGILVLTTLKSPEPKYRQGLKEYLIGAWNYLYSIRALSLFTATLVTFILLYGTFLTCFTLFLKDHFDASSLGIGLMMTAMSIASTVAASQFGTLNTKVSTKIILLSMYFLFGISLSLIPLMPNIWMLILPVAIYGLAQGNTIPGLQTAVSELAPMEYRAAFMSLYLTVLRFGQTIGAPLITLVLIEYGFDTTFFFSAGLALLAGFVVIFYRQGKNMRT